MNLDLVGRDWIQQSIAMLTDHVDHMLPSEFSEACRYLPVSVTSMPGPMRFDVNPYMREIIDCADINSPIREIILMKGVQITWTTLLESVALYFLAHLGTLPGMYVTADRELAAARIENNFIPMLHHSGMIDIIQSSDIGNSRKQGMTADHIQVRGGGFLVPFGANNPAKARQTSIAWMLNDEIDGWPTKTTKDGDLVKLFTDRCLGYWLICKILRGSTPSMKETSKIYKQYLRGDQRKYYVRCIKCGYAQYLKWSGLDDDTGIEYGMRWELNARGKLDRESVRYVCRNCGNGHVEWDKTKLFSPDNGAEWRPTEVAESPEIRSYHLPGLYSPVGFKPWSEMVAAFLNAYDPINKRVRDIGEYQVFYNNVLGWPWEQFGSKIKFEAVSAHRRNWYNYGQIVNRHVKEACGSYVAFLTATVDVHEDNLAVAVFGWSKGTICTLIDYWRWYVEEDDPRCGDRSSPVWNRLRELIEDKVYTDDRGLQYRLAVTLVDGGYATDTVVSFCAEYASNVYPILGRNTVTYGNNLGSFAEYKTKLGSIGFLLLTDYYKVRINSALRRQWMPGVPQNDYHFNAPVNADDAQLRELTREYLEKEIDKKGTIKWVWKRPAGAAQELWDLLVYGHASVDILANAICIRYGKMDGVSWDWFWNYFSTSETL